MIWFMILLLPLGSEACNSGGDIVSNRSRLSIVSIQMTIHDTMGTIGPVHVCSGSIITQLWVLTSASCFLSSEAALLCNFTKCSYSVFAVSAQLPSSDDRAYEIEKIYNHNNFFTNESLTLNDISLIKVSEPMNHQKYWMYARLAPVSFKLVEKMELITLGWGNFRGDCGPPHNRLQMFKLNFTNNCSLLALNNEKVREIIFCTIRPKCNFEGDLGSPILWQGVQVGVVSHVYEGCQSLYTAIAPFTKWIFLTLGPSDSYNLNFAPL